MSQLRMVKEPKELFPFEMAVVVKGLIRLKVKMMVTVVMPSDTQKV